MRSSGTGPRDFPFELMGRGTWTSSIRGGGSRDSYSCRTGSELLFERITNAPRREIAFERLSVDEAVSRFMAEAQKDLN